MRVSTLIPATVLAFSTLASAGAHGASGIVHHLDKRGAVINTSADVSTHVEKRTFGLLCGLLGGLFGGCSSGPSYPSRSWQCNGSGGDGQNYDYNGNGRPNWAPSGWLWFGSNKGWHPPKGWGIPSNNWSPPSSGYWNAGLCTWWAPTPAWQYPSSFLGLIPQFWLGLGWHSYQGPQGGWNGNGGGGDGWSYDYYGQPCPYGNNGFKFFGSKFGWGPPQGWQVPGDSYQFPSACLNLLDLYTWWSPSQSWNRPSGYNCPGWWGQQGGGGGGGGDGGDGGNDGGDGGNGNGYPSSGWECDGSGNDGYDHDPNGASCPYGNNGFKYFGHTHGWQPPKGWNVPSNNWGPPSGWASTCSHATWWAPSSSWQYPAGFVFPSFWISLGWSGYNWAPSSFVCNGSGNDGYLYDHTGNGLPSGYPSSWRYYGIAAQWQPVPSFSIPSKNWSPPGSWGPSHARWWSPKQKWNVPRGFQCPNWWQSSFLIPLGGILSWIL